MNLYSVQNKAKYKSKNTQHIQKSQLSKLKNGFLDFFSLATDDNNKLI